MAEHDKDNHAKTSADFEADPSREYPSRELVEEDLEGVAGGATSCIPDEPITLPGDEFFTPFNPAA